MYRKPILSVYCYYYDEGVDPMNLRSHFFEKKDDITRIFYEDKNAVDQIASKLTSLIPILTSRPIIFVCIGTDRSTGDSLGPLVGSKLKEKNLSNFHVYGTLENPIHAMNLNEQLNHILNTHQNPFIIGVDACLGRLKSVGSITIGDGPVKPGAGVNKELPPVGNIHLTGIVNVSGFMEFFVLQNTRLYLVMNMAEKIAEGILETEKRYKRKLAFSR
jgi:putative sporulation protein YyaC